MSIRNRLSKLTEEDWRDAMRKGIEESDSQAASIREMIDGGRNHQEKEEEEKKPAD